MKRCIRLRGMNGPFKGHTWESSELLRIGRLETLEIVLDDTSVSRQHAEVKATERGWRVRDLGSTNGTRLNGARLGNGQWPIRVKDLLQVGEVSFVVESMQDSHADLKRAPAAENGVAGTSDMRVAGRSKLSWDEAVEGVAFDSNRCPLAGEQLRALLRRAPSGSPGEGGRPASVDPRRRGLCPRRAARGDRPGRARQQAPDSRYHHRSGRAARHLVGRGNVGRFPFSQSLATRCFSRGESILYHSVDEDPELAMAKSIAEGAMGSVLCVLLRTPRKQLGVLHLDRSPWQGPFTMDDLHLADALAANVSMGIECAQLLRKQRDLFLATITMLAQTVELRDEYTGGHTYRVTKYSIMLAEHMNLSPSDIELIRIGTPLHDIGKIGIDDAILRKRDRLTENEFEIMKTHTIKGDEILAIIPDLHAVSPIVRSITSAGTAEATPTAWEAKPFRRWRASSPWPTPSTP